MPALNSNTRQFYYSSLPLLSACALVTSFVLARGGGDRSGSGASARLVAEAPASKELSPDVTYARLPHGPHRHLRIDLGCSRVDAFHLTPESDALVVLHGLKYGTSMEYTWSVQRGDRPHVNRTCYRQTGAV